MPTLISVLLPHAAMEALGFVVVVLSGVGFAYAIRGFRRSRYASSQLLRPQWLAIFLSRRVPRENVSLRDIEEQWFADMILWTVLGIVVGVAMIVHG